MWKRLSGKFKGTKGKRGFTLMELLTVVAIIAILCGLVTMAGHSIMVSLRFKQHNDYAKTIFLAAQNTLVEMRSQGTLFMVQADKSDAQEMPDAINLEVFQDQYVYTYSLGEARLNTFDLLLPANSVEAVLRDDHIIIEFNPVTGNVYSVFYSEEPISLSDYTDGKLPREESARKKEMLGYYCGSALSVKDLKPTEIAATLDYENLEEGQVVVTINTPNEKYVSGLIVNLTITGETSGKCISINNLDCEWSESDAAVKATYVLDSLKDNGSFAEKVLGDNPVDFKTLPANKMIPGENVQIGVEVKYDGEEASISLASSPVITANPMFAYLHDGKLAVSNGRNLQNLNLMAAAIAENVEYVVISDDIDWADITGYYSGYTSDIDEAPARALPNFVPIRNKALFGSEETGSRGSASILGNSKTISNLKIDSTSFKGVERRYYATGTSNIALDGIAGVFAYVNGSISQLTIDNAEVTGEKIVAGLVGQFGGTGKIANCVVKAKITATGANPTHVGGIAGINSGVIEQCGNLLNPANWSTEEKIEAGNQIDIIYSPSDGATAAIGGLVGQMNAGSLEGAFVSGAITWLPSNTLSRQYKAGGVVGYDAVDDSGNDYTYWDITSYVTVDPELKGSNTDAENVIDPSTVGNGSVGMFVGYVYGGRYSECQTEVENDTYQFLGQIERVMLDLDEGDWSWYYRKDKSPKPAITEVSVTSNEKELVDAAALKAGYTAVASNEYLGGFKAKLDTCTFLCGNTIFQQEFADGETFFKGTLGGATGVGYEISKYSSAYEEMCPKYTALSNTTTASAFVQTNFYYLDGSTYKRVGIKVEETTEAGYKYEITVRWGSGRTYTTLNPVLQYSLNAPVVDNDGNELVLYKKGFANTVDYIMTDQNFEVAFVPNINNADGDEIQNGVYSFETVFGDEFDAFAEALSNGKTYTYKGDVTTTLQGVECTLEDCFWRPTNGSVTATVSWKRTKKDVIRPGLYPSFNKLLGTGAYATSTSEREEGACVYTISYSGNYVIYDGSQFTHSTGKDYIGLLMVEQVEISTAGVQFAYATCAQDCIATKIES